MNEELIYQISMLQQQAEKIEEHIRNINSQTEDLEKFREMLSFLQNSNQSEFLSSLGKGVYMKTSALDKKLFVQVGAGVVVRKTPEQALSIIEDQIKRLNEAKIHFMNQREITFRVIEEALEEARNSENSSNEQISSDEEN